MCRGVLSHQHARRTSGTPAHVWYWIQSTSMMFIIIMLEFWATVKHTRPNPMPESREHSRTQRAHLALVSVRISYHFIHPQQNAKLRATHKHGLRQQSEKYRPSVRVRVVCLTKCDRSDSIDRRPRLRHLCLADSPVVWHVHHHYVRNKCAGRWQTSVRNPKDIQRTSQFCESVVFFEALAICVIFVCDWVFVVPISVSVFMACFQTD